MMRPKPARPPVLRDSDAFKNAFAEWLWNELQCPQDQDEILELTHPREEAPWRSPPPSNDSHEIAEARRGDVSPLMELFLSHPERVSETGREILRRVGRGLRPRRRDEGRPAKSEMAKEVDPARVAAELVDRAAWI